MNKIKHKRIIDRFDNNKPLNFCAMNKLKHLKRIIDRWDNNTPINSCVVVGPPGRKRFFAMTNSEASIRRRTVVCFIFNPRTKEGKYVDIRLISKVTPYDNTEHH